MNTAEAKTLLNRHGSTHEHEVGKYYADFDIKVYRPNIPDDLTEVEREFIEDAYDPYKPVRDELIKSIAALPTNSDVLITGRSGGWITVEFPYPSTDAQIKKIAKEIEQIKVLVRGALILVRSEKFWREFVEGVDPKSSPYYNPKTNHVTSIVMYQDDTTRAVLAITRSGRKYFYSKDTNMARFLAVLNSDEYDRQAEIGAVSKSLFVRFEKKS